MDDSTDEAPQEDKIRELAAEGKLVWANPAAEGVFPLNLNDHKKGEPYQFTHISVRGAWGKREYTDHPEWNNWGGFSVVWGAKGVGFGELSFRLVGGKMNEDTGELEGTTLECDSEAMGRRFIKEALMALAERVVVK